MLTKRHLSLNILVRGAPLTFDPQLPAQEYPSQNMKNVVSCDVDWSSRYSATFYQLHVAERYCMLMNGQAGLDQMPDARSSRGLNFILECLIFLCPQYGPCFMSPFWRLECLGGSWVFGNILCPCVRKQSCLLCGDVTAFPSWERENNERLGSWLVNATTRFKSGSRRKLKLNTNHQT